MKINIGIQVNEGKCPIILFFRNIFNYTPVHLLVHVHTGDSQWLKI